MDALTQYSESRQEQFIEDLEQKAGRTRVEIVPTIREGGWVPVMATFKETRGLPGILLARDDLGAPNEKYDPTSSLGGTKSCACLYEKLAKGA